MNETGGGSLHLRTRHADYESISSDVREMSVRAGTLVRMLFPPNPNGLLKEHPFGTTTEQVVVEKSICSVGHALREGAKIVDAAGNAVPEVEMWVANKEGGSAFRAKVFDPGEKYGVCFLVDSPPQFAKMHKAVAPN